MGSRTKAPGSHGDHLTIGLIEIHASVHAGETVVEHVEGHVLVCHTGDEGTRVDEGVEGWISRWMGG